MKLDHVYDNLAEGPRQKASRTGVEQVARPTPATTSEAVSTGPTGATEQPAVTVSLSPRVERTRQLIKTAQELPDIRQDRVAELRQAIESGSYQPKSEDIAGALLRSEKENR